MSTNKRDRNSDDEEFEEAVENKKPAKVAKKPAPTEEAVFSIGTYYIQA
jgi:hypothetical protein